MPPPTRPCGSQLQELFGNPSRLQRFSHPDLTKEILSAIYGALLAPGPRARRLLILKGEFGAGHEETLSALDTLLTDCQKVTITPAERLCTAQGARDFWAECFAQLGISDRPDTAEACVEAAQNRLAGDRTPLVVFLSHMERLPPASKPEAALPRNLVFVPLLRDLSMAPMIIVGAHQQPQPMRFFGFYAAYQARPEQDFTFEFLRKDAFRRWVNERELGLSESMLELAFPSVWLAEFLDERLKQRAGRPEPENEVLRAALRRMLPSGFLDNHERTFRTLIVDLNNHFIEDVTGFTPEERNQLRWQGVLVSDQDDPAFSRIGDEYARLFKRLS